jgi:hypothetical protein
MIAAKLDSSIDDPRIVVTRGSCSENDFLNSAVNPEPRWATTVSPPLQTTVTPLFAPAVKCTVALYDLTFAHARLKAANAGGSAVVRPGTALGVCAKVVAVLDKTIAAHAQISDASRT